MKAKALFDGCSTDALVLIDFHQLPIRIAFNPLGKMPDLHIKTANLFFFLCTDAAVRRNTQFWALLLYFLQLFRGNHNNAVAALIFRNLVLHELSPLFPAFGTAAKLTGRFYLLGVKRLRHILPPSNLQIFSRAAWVYHLLCANLSFHLYRLPVRLFMTSPPG